MPRFIAVLHDFLTTENDSMGFQGLLAGAVLVAHSPYFLALLLALIIRPKKLAFTRFGTGGAATSCLCVVLAFLGYGWMVNRTSPISVQFTDLNGEPIPNLRVSVVYEIRGLTKSTSSRRTEELILQYGHANRKKAGREAMTLTISGAEGLADTQVSIPGRNFGNDGAAKLPISISWSIKGEGKTRRASENAEKSWSQDEGVLFVPIPPAQLPLENPLRADTSGEKARTL